MSSFDQLLDEARAVEATREAAAPVSERRSLRAENILEGWDDFEPMGIDLSISARAVELIVVFEVSNQETYERRYRHPIWPKGKSGITVGIGYDVGYVLPAVLARDWRGNMSDANVETLTAACGVTGPAAKDLLATVGGVDIPFENAMSVFRDVTLGKTTAQTASFLPNVTHLSGDSLGALVSLVYNRGASFALPGDRFIEMRQIRDDVANLRFEQVPSRIRSMKRLWENDPDARGLVKRRELEAVLFEEGLAQI